MKRLMMVLLVAIVLVGCGSKESSGKYIDIRERSEYFEYNDLTIKDLNNNHLPDVKITQNKDGASRGTPANIGDTVIFKDWFDGEEIGISITKVLYGDDAVKVMKENKEYIPDPPKGKEYVLLSIKFESYDSKSEPYLVSATSFDVIFDDEKVEKTLFFEGELSSELRTGETFEEMLGFEIDEGSSDVFAVYEDEIWFSIK